MTSKTAERAARNLARVPESDRPAVMDSARELQGLYGYRDDVALLVAAGTFLREQASCGAARLLTVDGVRIEAGNMDMTGVNPGLADTRHVAAIGATRQVADGPQRGRGKRRELYALLVTGAVTVRVTEIAGVAAYYGPDEVIGHRDATSGPEAAGRELIAIARSRGLTPES